MSASQNGIFRKRRGKKNSKTRRLKRPKLFTEIGFDSSSDESAKNPQKLNSSDYQFQEVSNLTPSKSENETFESSEIVDSSCGLSENSFEFSNSNEDVPMNGSVVDQFKSDGDGDSRVEIISVDVGFDCRNEDLESRKVTTKREELKKVNQPMTGSISTESVLRDKKRKKKSKIKKSGTTIPLLIPINTKVSDNNFNADEQLYYTNDGIIVILTKNEKIYLLGLCQLSVLQGEIEILGHTLTKNSPKINIYSTRGSSLLYLHNVTKAQTSVTKYLLNLKISDKIKKTDNCAVILCEKLNDPQITFIEKHISQQILPIVNKNLPRIVFQPQEDNFNLLKVSVDWENIVNGVTNGTKLMICGGKGVGKTTFLRYAINRLLMKFSEVRVIDLDPGQSEFAIPGCISVVKVKNPVFGVNYTHLQETERSIVSNISIAYEPDKYIASVKELLNTNLDEIPTLVNYMGYTHGMGINILAAVVICIRPTDLLEIRSLDSKKNYKDFLEKHIVEENAKLFIPEFTELNYNLRQIWSMSDRNNCWTAEPRQLREMCVLAYISKIIESDSVFSARTPLYRISLSDIVVCDQKGENIHPGAINACLVTLCAIVNKELSIFQCLGWGIVRGIDLSTNELVLLTSGKLDILDQVTHLVSGGVTLPPSIYMTPDDVIGSMPYVMEGVLLSFGQITKRSRIPAKTV